MELKDIYKFNPRIISFKDVRRDALAERRKSKRKEGFDERRNFSEDCEVDLESAPSETADGKENRRHLLKKWKDERKKNNMKNSKKPFVVGIVRHNPGSPLFRSVPPLKEAKKTVKPQITKPQSSTSQTANSQISGTSGVYRFGKQKPVLHQFKVASSVKKLTVPITPSFMDPTKRGKIASKPKPKSSRVADLKLKTNEKRVTRAATAAATKKHNEVRVKQEQMNCDDIACNMNTAKPAQEFYDRLQTETDFLLECCERWSKPAFTQTVPQDISDEIDSTVGQAKLLVSDKFLQFKHLIERFEEDSKPPVTSEDLNGFWDMMNIQVEKMKQRFDQLTELKNNNWIKKTVEVVAKKKIVSKPKAKLNVKSRFQEFMAKKKIVNSSNENFDSQNVTAVKNSEESQSKTGTPTNTPSNDRVMQQVLNKTRSERRRSSFASASHVLRTSLIGKTLAMSPLVQTGEMSAIETRKSILRNNCPSSPLTTFAHSTVAKKKVGFGIEEPVESIDSPMPKRIPRTPRFAGVSNLTDDDDSGTETIAGTPGYAVNFNNLTDDDDSDSETIAGTPEYAGSLTNKQTNDNVDDSNTVPQRNKVPPTLRSVTPRRRSSRLMSNNKMKH